MDLKLRIVDYYIIRKFLGTFVYALALIISIAVIFDFAEKLDDFIENEAPLRAILFDYYLNFIPYFAVLFSPLFTFITVIFFTSKMAYNTEIIALLSNGMSFTRLLWPYFLSALLIAIFTFVLNNFVIPHANKERLEFEEIYYRSNPVRYTDRDIHKQILPNVYVYMESYSNIQDVGYKFSMEEFNDSGKLKSKLIADYIKWDTALNKWSVRNYYIRTIDGLAETIQKGRRLDTTLTIYPSDFARRENIKSTMNMHELNRFISQQKLQGADNVEVYMIERYSRYAMPFSTFILTLIGLTLSSRKAKEGIGAQIGAGIFLSFSYIFFMQFSAQFAISGSIPALLAVWIPNILYAIIAAFLFVLAPK